jgi:hypothetical protein
MAKEKFVRDKPHVNIGTLDFGKFVTDSSGQLSYNDDADSSDASRAPSMLVGFNAPGSLNLESAVVAFPIDSDF